jgi:hypothetical protein
MPDCQDKQAGHTLARVQCVPESVLAKPDEVVKDRWQLVLSSSCICMTADARVVVLATKDGLVHVVSLTHGDRFVDCLTTVRMTYLYPIQVPASVHSRSPCGATKAGQQLPLCGD